MVLEKDNFFKYSWRYCRKSSGKVNVWGFNLDENPRQIRASIGIVPQEVNLDAFLV